MVCVGGQPYLETENFNLLECQLLGIIFIFRDYIDM